VPKIARACLAALGAQLRMRADAREKTGLDQIAFAESASVEDFGCRSPEGISAGTGGRRPKSSKGGIRGPEWRDGKPDILEDLEQRRQPRCSASQARARNRLGC
jgi:hypothetical protein